MNFQDQLKSLHKEAKAQAKLREEAAAEAKARKAAEESAETSCEEAMKGKLSMAAAEMQQQIKKSDGKISVSTGEVTYTNADKTEARVTVIFKGKKDGNEQEKSQKVSVIKTGQGWKIKM